MKHKIALMNIDLCLFGGTGRVTVNLSRELMKDYDCYIITQWDNGKRCFDVPEEVTIFNLYPERRRLRHMFFDATKRIKQYVEEEGIEALIAVGRNNGIIPLLVKLALGASVKLIWCEHNAITSYRFYKESWKQKLLRKIHQQLILRVPDRLTVLTERERQCYQDMYQVDPKEIDVIPNFIEASLLQAERPYKGEKKWIITVASIYFQKGHEYLIEVAKRVLSKHPDWEWHLWGNGDAAYTEEIAGKIQAAGLAGKLILKGADREIYKRYGDYALQVVTSRYEGFSMVLLEGKVNHLPEVSFDIHSGPSDLILDGVNGYLVKPFDVEAMAERIDFLIEHPEVRRAFSARAYDNIDGFRKEAVMKQWVDLINNVLKSGGGKPSC